MVLNFSRLLWTWKGLLTFLFIFLLSNRLKLVTRRQVKETSSWAAQQPSKQQLVPKTEEKADDEDQQGPRTIRRLDFGCKERNVDSL